MQDHDVQPSGLTGRLVLGGIGIASLALMSSPASAQETVDLHVPGGPSTRIITTSYPQKGRMILQRSSPPWLETPFEVFDKGVFTPNVSATATACRRGRQLRRGASPSVAIAALAVSISRSMAARAGSRPSSVPTRDIRLSAMADTIHAACARRAHPDGSLHQYQERGAARFPDLESGRLPVQYH